MSKRIGYADKDDSKPVTDERRKFFDNDANEIKNVVNAHADELEELENIPEEVTQHTEQIAALQQTINEHDYRLDAVTDRFKGVYGSYTDLVNVNPTGQAGDWAEVDSGVGYGTRRYDYDVQDGWVEHEGNNVFPNIVTDAASITLTREYSRLSTSRSTLDVAINFLGPETVLEIILTNTSCVVTFPYGAKCTYGGTPTGNNTMTLSGTSGDRYLIVTSRIGNTFYPLGKNMVQ